MTRGRCCRHLAHGKILTFRLSFAMGAGEASPSSQLFAVDLQNGYMSLETHMMVSSTLLHLDLLYLPVDHEYLVHIFVQMYFYRL